jgi:hypothetical protein
LAFGGGAASRASYPAASSSAGFPLDAVWHATYGIDVTI